MLLKRSLIVLSLIFCSFYLYYFFGLNFFGLDNIKSWKIAIQNYSILNASEKINPSSKWIKYLPKKMLKETYNASFENSKRDVCSSKSIKLILVVITAPESQDNRMCIRKTWGFYKNRPELEIVFLIGNSVNSTMNTEVQKENQLFNDIVKINLLEDYYNLTYKTVAMLEFVISHCQGAKFLMKLDDDIFVNIPKILMFLESHRNDKRKIYGNLLEGKDPIRDQTNKYFASEIEYSGNIYPNYVNGPSYLMTTDILHELYNTSLNTPYLKYEDVFLTGLVAQQLNIDIVNVYEFNNYPSDEESLQNMDDDYTFNMNYVCDDIFYIWQKHFEFYRKRNVLE